jgi:hypothetical protein
MLFNCSVSIAYHLGVHVNELLLGDVDLVRRWVTFVRLERLGVKSDCELWNQRNAPYMFIVFYRVPIAIPQTSCLSPNLFLSSTSSIP